MTAVWLLLITQVFYCFMYGFFIRVNPTAVVSSEGFIHTAFLFILIILGFGLALSRPYKLTLSHLGFNLLITALSVQTFFLINAFWTKARIYFDGRGNAEFNTDIYNVSLTPSSILSEGADLNEALKCALSIIVAFSFVVGRAGLLEIYFLTTSGTIVYELARQVCLNNYPYELGSIKIFFYGGVLGLMTSFVIHRLGKEGNIVAHPNYIQNRMSITISLVGTAIVWLLFPLLSREVTGIPEVAHASSTLNSRVIAIYLATAAAGLFAIFVGSVKFGFRLVTNTIIGSGVAILTASAYISNPVYAVVFGLASAAFQIIFNVLAHKWEKISGPIDPNAFAFVGQGFFGIFLATINRGIIYSNSN